MLLAPETGLLLWRYSHLNVYINFPEQWMDVRRASVILYTQLETTDLE